MCFVLKGIQKILTSKLYIIKITTKNDFNGQFSFFYLTRFFFIWLCFNHNKGAQKISKGEKSTVHWKHILYVKLIYLWIITIRYQEMIILQQINVNTTTSIFDDKLRKTICVGRFQSLQFVWISSWRRWACEKASLCDECWFGWNFFQRFQPNQFR